VLLYLDLFRGAKDLEVGLCVTSADDRVRRLFEPLAPAIDDRVRALDELHRAGIRTYAMIAPLLPGAEDLAERLAGKVDFVLVDRMNHDYGNWVYRKYGLGEAHSDAFFRQTAGALASAFEDLGVPCRVVF